MLNILNNTEKFITLICLISMTVIIIVQVIFRYFIGSALTWPDELARYLFIYATYFGISYVEHEEKHLSITTIRTYCGTFGKKYVPIIVYLISAAICIVLTFWGISMVDFVKTTNQISPYMQFPMYFLYFCLPFGFGLTAIRTLINLYNYCRKMNDDTA